jgi:hypothetical protein
MTKQLVTVPEDRALSGHESRLLTWLLEHGKPSARAHLGEVERVRVVSQCGCGCASIDFVDATRASMEILSEHKWQDANGHLFGVFAFARKGRLAGLEVWSIDGEATPTVLPATSSLEPFE